MKNIMSAINKRSQASDVLDHLKKHRCITPFEAFNYYGAVRLPVIISLLKKRGYVIETEIVKGKNRYGHTNSYARYHFIKDIEEE